MEELLIKKEQIESAILDELRALIKKDELDIKGHVSFSVIENKYTISKFIPRKVQVENIYYKADEDVYFKVFGEVIYKSSEGETSKDDRDLNIYGEAIIDITREGQKAFLITKVIDNQITISKK